VELRTGARVERLLVEEGRVVGVQLAAPAGERVCCQAAIVATGGASYPATGSSGDGARLAEAAGHTIVPLRPALVPLEVAGDAAPRLQGLALRGVTVRLYVGGKKRAALCGDVLFTHVGLSGPAILSLSRPAVDGLRGGQAVALELNLFPEMDERALDERLRGALEAHGKQHVANVLAGLLPQRLVAVALEQAGIPAEEHAGRVSAAARRQLRAWLQGWRLEVTGHRPWSEAQVTAGGVDLREVDPETMASRRVRGLYIAGEVLDLDAGTGGYNLQAAFSTGWVAGVSAATACAAHPTPPG